MYFYCPICVLDFATTQSNLNLKILIILGVLCNYLDMTIIVRMTHSDNARGENYQYVSQAEKKKHKQTE